MPTPAHPWLPALAVRAVWQRALMIGLPVGFLQICLNQGDHWLHGTLTRVIILKTILTPIIAVAVCLVSAASTYRTPASSGKIEHQGSRIENPHALS